jgi:ABC-2 type transport system permease protein
MPTPFDVIVFGKNLANVFQSLLSMVVSYLLAAFLFGYSLSLTQPFLFFVTLLLSMFAFICFGLTIAPVFVMYRSVQQWQNAMEFPVYILCGFLFPITLLPNWSTPISYTSPFGRPLLSWRQLQCCLSNCIRMGHDVDQPVTWSLPASSLRSCCTKPAWMRRWMWINP